MERKLIVLLLSFAITASFFFPVFDWNSFEMTGLNYILSDYTPSCKYLLLLIPLVSASVFLVTYYNENFVPTPKLISWTPFLALVLVFILSSIKEGFFNLLPKIDIGFCMMLIFSLSLALVLNEHTLTRRHNIEFADIPADE